MAAERGWRRKFDDPIPLPRGRQLVTLQDAGEVHHAPSESQTLDCGVAGSPDPGRDAWRPNNVCADRCHASVEPAFRRIIRAGRGQVGPCLTDAAHRPLPERRSCVSRYASARVLQKRSLRQILQVESFYLLCLRPTQLLAHRQSCVVLPCLSSCPSGQQKSRRCDPAGR